MSRRRHRCPMRWALLAMSLVLLATACNARPQDALTPRGHYSRISHTLFLGTLAVAGVVFVLVEGLILIAVFRFRARSAEDRPEQIHGNFALELTWTLIPAVLLVVIGVLTVGKLFQLDREPSNPVRIEVIGHQWWWEYRYMDPRNADRVAVVTANELHIPVKRNVRLDLTSGDVIHNFWPPKLAGKIYAVPGRHNKLFIEADEPALYYGECAEYCGLSHANMRLRVVAQSQGDFDTWMDQQSVDRPAEIPDSVGQKSAYNGSRLFLQKGCSGCHTVNGYSVGNVGPNLTNFNSRATFAGAIFSNNDDNLRRWLRDPPGEKPGSKMPNLHLSEPDITDLMAYLRTLGYASARPS